MQYCTELITGFNNAKIACYKEQVCEKMFLVDLLLQYL